VLPHARSHRWLCKLKNDRRDPAHEDRNRVLEYAPGYRVHTHERGLSNWLRKVDLPGTRRPQEANRHLIEMGFQRPQEKARQDRSCHLYSLEMRMHAFQFKKMSRVCTENLNPHIMVMKPAQDWV
jgi:hypothetical protein